MFALDELGGHGVQAVSRRAWSATCARISCSAAAWKVAVQPGTTAPQANDSWRVLQDRGVGSGKTVDELLYGQQAEVAPLVVDADEELEALRARPGHGPLGDGREGLVHRDEARRRRPDRSDGLGGDERARP